MFSTYVSHRETRLNAEVLPAGSNDPASRLEVTGCVDHISDSCEMAVPYCTVPLGQDVGAWSDIRSGCQLYIPTVLSPEEAGPLAVGLEVVWVYVSV